MVTIHTFIDIVGDSIRFTWEVTVEFTADVTYEDMDTAIYESEDKVAYAWQDIQVELERAYDLSIHGEVRFRRWPPHDPLVTSVDLEPTTDIGITAVEWENYK